MKAVPSSYHQLIKFPTSHGVGEIRGDPVAAKQCFLTACATKGELSRVEMMELHKEVSTIDDVGQPPESKASEELKKIYIDRQEEKYFVLGSSLSKVEESTLMDLLSSYLEVFAWTPYDMPGIAPTDACYRLNANPQC